MRKVTHYTIIMLIVLIGIISANSIEVKASEISISKDDAIKVTQNFISNSEHKSSWIDYELTLKYDLYDTDDSILGYYFEIKKDEKYLGYVITSATKEREPILQYGEGLFYDDPPALNEKLYFVNPFFKVSARDKTQLKENYNRTKNNILKKLNEDVSLLKGVTEESKKLTAEIKEVENKELVPLKKILLLQKILGICC